MSTSPKRLHHLDALRSFAMLLGIVLHASLSFIPFPWPVQDSEQNTSLYLVFYAIHGFRMPLFFLLSGFFTAMLWRKRGVLSLVKHRVKRVLLPLVIGCFTIIPATNWAIEYVARAQGSSAAPIKIAELAPLNRDDIIGQTNPQKLNLLTEAAIRRNDSDSLMLLIEQGADVNYKSEIIKISALHWAAGLGHTEMATILLDQGADINTGDENGSTAMHWAALFGRPLVAALLIERGADLARPNNDGATPFSMSTPEARAVVAPLGTMLAGLLEIPFDENNFYADSEALHELILNSSYTPQPIGYTQTDLLRIPLLHHLWFLWYLFLLVVAFCCTTGAAKYISGLKRLTPLVVKPFRYLWMLPLVAFCQLQMGPESFGPDTSTALLPNLSILIYYAVFFFFGAAYFLSDDHEERLGRYFWLTLPAAFCALLVGIGHLEPGAGSTTSMAWWVAAYTCFMSFGLIGLCRKIFSTEKAWVRYVSDASYWMYLAHLPLVFLAQKYVTEWNALPLAKLAVICIGLAIILLASYQLLVRHTPIGWLLNGRRK
jgi:peptidoglycan/LPS O-acetylase OafA/YrhL